MEDGRVVAPLPGYDDIGNLNIVLIVKEYKFVLTESCLAEPGKGATDEEIQACWRWKKADEMAWFYILSFLSNAMGILIISVVTMPLTGFGSHENSEVKRAWTREIPGWVTPWEAGCELPETKP
ncbi:hypothetical protein LguiA_012987 [Lonicera macranthoides]